MDKTHWKSLTNPNYLGGYSIPEGLYICTAIAQHEKESRGEEEK